MTELHEADWSEKTKHWYHTKYLTHGSTWPRCHCVVERLSTYSWVVLYFPLLLGSKFFLKKIFLTGYHLQGQFLGRQEMGTSPWDIRDNLWTSGSPPSKHRTFRTGWYTWPAFLWTFLHVCLQRWASAPPGQRSCLQGSPHLPSCQMSSGCCPKWDAAQP